MNTRSKKYFPVKPARSYEEQLTRLSEIHDLTIGDPDRARYILSTVNYYRLTTYGKHLRRADDPEKFQPGVTLETLFGLYQFDMNLAITYGSLGYMDAENFRAETLANGSSVHKNLMGKFKNEVKRQGALPFVRHHKIKYGGQFPIWAAVELFTFGMLASLFDIMKESDQRAVSRAYDLSPEALSALMNAAVNVRNICAHYNRLYNQPLEEQPILPNRLRLYESNRLFPLLLTFAHTLGRERVFTRLVTGVALLEEDYPEADLACCGFPENWREILENEIS